MPPEGIRTRLDSLVRQRLLTRNEARELLVERAIRMGVTERKFALSERQFYRLLFGEVKTRPHPVVCRVIEAEFGYPIDELLAPVPDPTVVRSMIDDSFEARAA